MLQPTDPTLPLRAALAALYGHDERGRFADIAKSVLDDVWEIYTKTGHGQLVAQIVDHELLQWENTVRKRKEKAG